MEMTKQLQPTSSSPVGALITMFYEPSATFAALEKRKHAWLPAILLIITTTTLMVWYMSVVDMAWLTDQMFASIKNVAEREQAAAMMSPQVLKTMSILGGAIAVPIMLVLIALYFMIAGKVLSKEFTFGTGFALGAWASVPALLTLPLGAMQIMLASNGQLTFSELNPLSLNTLLFQYDMNHPMTSLLDSVSVLSVWSAFLLVIGFQVWGKVTLSTAIKVVAIPYVTIYGIWLAVALSTSA